MVETAKVKPLRPVINELRIVKSDAEVTNMRFVGQASGRAFTQAMRRKFTREKDLAAFLDYQFKLNGCDTNAYVPVVAGGDVSRHPSICTTSLNVLESSQYTLRQEQ